MKASIAMEQRRVTDSTINKILQDVAELSNRTSPEDQPDMMLVTLDELRGILNHHLRI